MSFFKGYEFLGNGIINMICNTSYTFKMLEWHISTFISLSGQVTKSCIL